jgi:hypothetical protein
MAFFGMNGYQCKYFLSLYGFELSRSLDHEKGIFNAHDPAVCPGLYTGQFG